MTAFELSRLLGTKKASSVEITRSVLDRIDAVEAKTNSYITVDPEMALQMATEADAKLASGLGGILTGIPIAVKDNMCVRGRRTK